MSSFSVNVTNCVQDCLYRFQQPEVHSGNQNAICLSTAAVGFFILMSGFQDLQRAVSGLVLKKHKWTLAGNSILGLIGIFKIINGITFIANAFAYEPFKWNTTIHTTCKKVCADLISIQPTSLPDRDIYPPNECCIGCVNELGHPNGADNFGIVTGFGVPLMVMETAKTLYSIGRAIKNCCGKIPVNSLINLPVKRIFYAKTDFLQDVIALCYAIALFVLISSNVIGNDNNLYDWDSEFSSSFAHSSSGGTSDTFRSKCANFCRVLYPETFQSCMYYQ